MINPEKFDMLLHWLGRLDSAAVAFSGGVDSTFVLAAAYNVLGDKVLAYTVKTPYIPEWELQEAVSWCQEKGIRHQVIHTGILPDILQNPENRCYLCKKHLFTLLKNEAHQAGIVNVLDGSNADDTGVYRPGLAALRELGVRSPLLENGITKPEVRHFSAKMGLATAEKPSYACLLTRLPYNYKVSEEELRRVEKAERYLAAMGFASSRVRNHGDIARIEVDRNRIDEFAGKAVSANLAAYFRDLGYAYVTLDLEGYRSGSFDKNISEPTI